MSTATAELAGLLRGCVKWRDGRAWVDNDALLVVADWCEDNEKAEEAAAIRAAFRTGGEVQVAGEVGAVFSLRHSRPLADGVFYETTSQTGGGRRSSAESRGEAVAHCAGRETLYEVEADEIPPPVRDARQSPTRAGVDRIRDLARWHCVAHMLGWPPLRLVGEE